MRTSIPLLIVLVVGGVIAVPSASAVTVLVDEVHGQPCLTRLQELLPDHDLQALTIADLPIETVLLSGSLAVMDTALTFTVPAGAEMLYGRFEYPPGIYQPPFISVSGPGGGFVVEHFRGAFHVENPVPGEYSIDYSTWEPMIVPFAVGTGPCFFTEECLAGCDVLFRLHQNTFFLFIGWVPEYSAQEMALIEARVVSGGGCLMVREPLLEIALKPIIDLTAVVDLECDIAVDLPGALTYAVPEARTERYRGGTTVLWDGVEVFAGETTRLLYEGALSPSRPWIQVTTDGPTPRVRNLSDEPLYEVILVRCAEPGRWSLAAGEWIVAYGEGNTRVESGLTRDAVAGRLARALTEGGLAAGLSTAQMDEFLGRYRWVDRVLNDAASGGDWTALFRIDATACDRFLPLVTEPSAASRSRTLWFWVAGIPPHQSVADPLPALELTGLVGDPGAASSSLVLHEYGVIKQTYPAPAGKEARNLDWFGWLFWDDGALVDPTDNCGSPECPYFDRLGGHPDAASMLEGVPWVEGMYSGAVYAPWNERVLCGDEDAQTDDGTFQPGSLPAVAVAKSLGQGRVAAIHDSDILQASWPGNETFVQNMVAWVAGPGTSVDETDTPAAAVRLVSVRPNPFNPRTEIVLELDRAEHVRLTIHDAVGRRVAALVDEPLPAGIRRVVWDGRDDEGRAAPSGTYFVRLVSAEERLSQKITLIR